MAFKLNKKKIEENKKDFKALPRAKYLARLEKIEEDETKNEDALWILQWGIAKGEHKGRKVFDNLVFKDSVLDRVLSLCKALNVEVPEDEDFDLEPDMLKGKLCYIKVKKSKYEGESKNEIPYSGYKAAPKDVIEEALEDLEDLEEDEWEDDTEEDRDEDFEELTA